MKRIVRKDDVLFTLFLTAILFVDFLGWTAFGFKIRDDINLPGFNSLLDLQNHKVESLTKATKTNPNFSKWNKWAMAELSQGPTNRFLEHERHRMDLLYDSLQPKNLNGLNGNFERHFITRHKLRSGISDIGNNIQDKPSPTVQFWSKRDTSDQIISSNTGENRDTKTNLAKKQYILMDEALQNLEPDNSCTSKLGLCAKNPLKNLDCILHCHLSTHSLANPSTKFLFRLFKLYSSFPKMLCPTFGTIYDKIPSILKKRTRPDLRGFLASVGIVDQAPANVDFIKNFPSSLFNSLIKSIQREGLEVVKSVLSAAETAVAVQLSEKSQFPSLYGNPLCKLAPKESWFVSMIDAMIKRPTFTDIFLSGYWILTRALDIGLPYSVNSIFASMAYSLKMMTGVDCSIIAYAEQGKPFKCGQPSPVDEILNFYSELAEEKDADNEFSWMVCGAHQVEIPEWIQIKEELKARNEKIEVNTTSPDDISFGSLYDDLDKFPNPDEIMY